MSTRTPPATPAVDTEILRLRRRGCLAALAAGLLLVSASLLLAITLLVGWTGRAPPILDDDGRPLPGGVALLEPVPLGGMTQWVQIRGHDPQAPILLWLHGGPGGPQMPFAHAVDGPLERHFLVVHWDQRGAGKSNPRSFDPTTMVEERYIEDTLELLDWLETRLGPRPVLLLGHSWGSQFGIRVAQRHPERIAGWIGVGQVVHRTRANALAVDWLRETLDPVRDAGDLAHLDSITLPALDHADFRTLNTLLTRHGGSLDRPPADLLALAARSPAYGAGDLLRLVRGMQRGGGPMHPGGRMAEIDLLREVPRLDVPATFVVGARDFNTPRALVEAFHDALDAPSKTLVVLPNAAHQPFLSDPDGFHAAVIEAGRRATSPTTPATP